MLSTLTGQPEREREAPSFDRIICDYLSVSDATYQRYCQFYYPDFDAWSLVNGTDSKADELPKSVRFLRRRRDGKLGVLVCHPLDDDDARALDGRVYALAGTAALVRSIARGHVPAGVEMLALRGASPADLATLAATDLIATIHGLAVLDGEARTDELLRLLDGRASALRSLSIFNASDELVRALREPLLSSLESLRIVAPPRGASTTHIDLSRVLGGARRATTTLELAHIELTSALVAAWERGDWSRLDRLRVHCCAVDGSSLGPFPALRELRSTASEWTGPRSLPDAAVAAIVQSSPELEIVSLEGSDAGDDAASAVAEHGRRAQYVDFNKSRVGSAGALALGRSTVFEQLEFFQLDSPLSFDAAYALADSAIEAIRKEAHVPHRGLATIASWRPAPPRSESAKAPAVVRWFRWQRYQECPSCGGHVPWDGCPGHEPLVIHSIDRGTEPPTEPSRAWVATHSAFMTRVEQLGCQMLETMRTWGKYDGAVRVTWWLLDDEHRGCDLAPFDAPQGFDAIIDAVGRPPYATSASWAHACARARAREFTALPDPYTPARAIADLGASIVGLDAEDGLLIALRAPFALA